MRVALLGSPGIGVPYRPVFQISGAGVSKTGAAATYAAVTANHVLVITSRNWPTVTVTFDGTEASQASFLAKINAQSLGRFTAVNVAGQIKITSTNLGSMSQAAVDGATSADVLASLGITATAFGTAATSARAPYGRAAIAYDGGALHQRFLAGSLSAFILDRNAANTVFSDNVQQKPNPAVP